MKNNKSKGEARSSLSRLTRRKYEMSNDWLFDNEANEEESKSSATRQKPTPLQLLSLQFREAFQHNELNWSINQMNKYLQSPNHFKMIYNTKMKLYNGAYRLFGFFRKEVMNSTGRKYNTLQGSRSFKANKVFTLMLIGSLGIGLLSTALKRRMQSSKMGWLLNRLRGNSPENIIANLRKQNQELLKANIDLLSFIKEKHKQ